MKKHIMVMSVNKLFLVYVVNLVLFVSLQAASFDCKKASSSLEHTICNDLKLSKLDEDLATSYKNSMKNISNKEQLKKEQLDWIKNERNNCQTIECLQNSYSNRIAFLNKQNTKNISNNNIVGEYIKGEASIQINPDLTFEYIVVNPKNGNMCNISDEKFTKVNDILIWQSKDNDCTIEISELNKNLINLTTKETNCSYYCGMNVFIEEGSYKNSIVEIYTKKDEASAQINPDNEVKPKFNSLAEEEAYNKQQQEKKNLEKQQKEILEQQFLNECNQFTQERIDFYKMFLVKKDDTKELIDKKYQNSEKIVQEVNQKYIALKSKAIELKKFGKNLRLNCDFIIDGDIFSIFQNNKKVRDDLENTYYLSFFGVVDLSTLYHTQNNEILSNHFIL